MYIGLAIEAMPTPSPPDDAKENELQERAWQCGTHGGHEEQHGGKPATHCAARTDRLITPASATPSTQPTRALDAAHPL